MGEKEISETLVVASHVTRVSSFQEYKLDTTNLTKD